MLNIYTRLTLIDLIYPRLSSASLLPALIKNFCSLCFYRAAIPVELRKRLIIANGGQFVFLPLSDGHFICWEAKNFILVLFFSVIKSLWYDSSSFTQTTVFHSERNPYPLNPVIFMWQLSVMSFLIYSRQISNQHSISSCDRVAVWSAICNT